MQPVKNKVLVYLLFCAVAIVWGIILQKVFFKPEENSLVVDRRKAKAYLEGYSRYDTITDTFRLVLNYRDPFSDRTGGFEKPNENEEHTISTPVMVETKAVVAWPEIKYNGRIVNPRTKKSVTLMSVNGVERMVEEGQKFEGIELVKNRQDSVLVQWNGLTKHIKQ
jgi:hypothetical protein